MIIAYDAHSAIFHNDEPSTDNRALLEALAQLRTHDQFMLYTVGMPSDTSNLASILSQSSIHIKEPHHTPMLKWRWSRGSGIIRRASHHHASLFHGLDGELPSGIERSGMIPVVSIGSLETSDEYGMMERMGRNSAMQQACRVAERIIVPSRDMAQQVQRRLGADPSKIAVIYQGADEAFFDVPSRDEKMRVARKYSLPQHFVLCRGPIDKNHNIAAVMRALAQVQDTHLRLVIVGHRTAEYKQLKEEARQLGVRHRLERLREVKPSDIPTIMHMATVVAHTPLQCTTTRPVAEGIAVGKPMVIANLPALTEAAGNAAIAADPNSPQEIAAAIDAAMGSQASALASAAAMLAPQQHMSRQAQQVLDLYRDLRD